MKYLNARSSQRFVAFLLDNILIRIIMTTIVSFIPAYQNSSKIISDFYLAYLDGVFIENMDVLLNVLKHIGISYGIQMAVHLPLFISYMIVLPYFWQHQTLGRFVMHLKVVTKTEEKVTWKHLILREFVGGFILLQGLSSFVVIPILFWYFSSSTGRSLADMIGGTRLIDTRFINADFLEKEEQAEEKEYVDATFTEVPSEPTNETSEPEDTDYKVF